MTLHHKHYPAYIDLLPAMHVQGPVILPGSKSISNRTLLLAALAQGSTEIRDLLAARAPGESAAAAGTAAVQISPPKKASWFRRIWQWFMSR